MAVEKSRNLHEDWQQDDVAVTDVPDLLIHPLIDHIIPNGKCYSKNLFLVKIVTFDDGGINHRPKENSKWCILHFFVIVDKNKVFIHKLKHALSDYLYLIFAIYSLSYGSKTKRRKRGGMQWDW